MLIEKTLKEALADYDWWKIAQIMDYSERWIYELHGRALKKIEIS